MPPGTEDREAAVRNPIEEENKENLPPPNQEVRLSRSPHPYHRCQPSPADPILQSSNTVADHQLTSATSAPYEMKISEDVLLDINKEKPWKTATSSDSGTEADDESGGVLRGLPAPPIRRKGSSPLLTPRNIDDRRRKSCLELKSEHRGSRLIPSLSDEERSKIRDKFTRRRRAERLRRLSETIFLCSVGMLSCGKGHGSFSHSLSRALAGYLGVVFGTHLLYPLRLLYRRRIGFMPIRLNPHFLRIPAFFDPAPLLYPTLLPIFVACSLTPLNPKIVLANLILSIAAIPCQVIPFDYLGSGYNLFHWFLTAIPLFLVRKGTLGFVSNSFGDAPIHLDQFDTEKFSVLYPLHQALLPALGYLTTTSLLPAELQLLSISSINLLLFSSSSQATILKALLWVGGLLIFILCGGVLRWGVALARVPSWRFRHTHRPPGGVNVLLVAIDDYFHGRLTKWRLISAVHDSSDSDVSVVPGAEKTQKARLERLRVEIPRRTKGMQDSGLKQSISAIDEATQIGLQNSGDPSATQMRRYRRHTLLSYVASPQGAPLVQRTSLVPPSRPAPSKPRSFLSMTFAQATVLKWCYALYLYLVALLVIAIPIRIAISHWALQGHEPVGWALGYLFGNIPMFRSITFDLHLQNWICLPPSIEPDQNWKYGPWNEYLHHIGAANTRLIICVYCLGVLAAGLSILFRLTAFVEVDTRRKAFHGMMVAMFLPSILVDPAFAALALSLALAVFLLLDIFRASQLPPLSRPLTHFLAPYVDGRDHRGPVIVSHMFLLIGCAIPLWLSLAAVDRTGAPPWEGWEVPTRDLSMVSGVVCVGMGDAAASLFGRRFGRRRWVWSGGKSLEGSFAFALAVVLGLLVAKLGIRLGGWDTNPSGNEGWLIVLSKSTAAALGASFTEAVLTGGNDNVIVPVVLWLLVRGLAI